MTPPFSIFDSSQPYGQQRGAQAPATSTPAAPAGGYSLVGSGQQAPASGLASNPLMGLYQRMGGATAMPPELVNNPFIKGMAGFFGQIGAAAPQLAPYTSIFSNYLGGQSLPAYTGATQMPSVYGQPDATQTGAIAPAANGPTPQNSAYMQPTNALIPPWLRGDGQSASAYGPIGNAMAGMFGARQSAY